MAMDCNNMTLLKIFVLICCANFFVDAKAYHHQKREVAVNICSPNHNSTLKVQCFCTKDKNGAVKTADCYLTTENISPDDQNWDEFNHLANSSRLTLTNTRGITLKYVPTKAFKHITSIAKLDIKYGHITKVQGLAFANITSVEEITLRDNQIEVLEKNAFAHHPNLHTISLDKNNIVEINRDVFVDLPTLDKLFLTSNKITTIHDKAFMHLINLKELEIDRNSLFSLNSESFSGLKKLHKLDLSSNALEVIGDNTFQPLVNLQFLNLEGNKIEMLDEKAFNGLVKLRSLSLARNKITTITNLKVFENLESLTSLSLRGNQIRELKPEVMAPILNNFYRPASALDVEDNNFPCDCRLDWFMLLMNNTQNKDLKLVIENLKCFPDANTRELWTKNQEIDKTAGQVFEDEESQVQNADYEYYDESQLNGKLFYIDIRDLLNCSTPTQSFLPSLKPTEVTKKPSTQSTRAIYTSEHTHPSVPMVTNRPTVQPTTRVTEFLTQQRKLVTNKGLLELADDETTPKPPEDHASDRKAITGMKEEKKPDFYTTSRLATVSAKPIDNNHLDEDMASDEAKPDKIKAHRSIQEEVHSTSSFNTNSAQRNFGCVTMLVAVLIRQF